MRWAGLVWLVVGCGDAPAVDTGPDSQGTCPILADPTCDVRQVDTVEDGAAVMFGTPPQGGAPYAPFTLRFRGLDQAVDGLDIRMLATDEQTGEILGDSSYHQWLACANVGEHAGWLVGPEFHLRFAGWELDELDGRETLFEVSAVDQRGKAAEAKISATLSLEL